MTNIQENPWRGLEAYQDGEILYGRDDDIKSLSQYVIDNVDTVLYGRSGIGKSSLINAGIIPAARRNGFHSLSIHLVHENSTEKGGECTSYVQQIRNSIKASGITIREKSQFNGKTELIWELFHRNEFYEENGKRCNLLIIFDQFEEIFTLQKQTECKRRFFAEMADMLNDIKPNELTTQNKKKEETISSVNVVSTKSIVININNIGQELDSNSNEFIDDNDVHFIFTLREDFLSDFEYYTSSIPSLKQHRYGLRPINEEQAAEIILRPRMGLVTKDVAKLIIQKVTQRTDFELDGIPEIEVDSAILSLYLSRLYEEKKEECITAELVEQKGGEIISSFYCKCIENIEDSKVKFLEDTLVNDDGRRENKSESSITKEIGQDIVNHLIDVKLLRRFSYANDMRIEFIHDTLCDVVQKRKVEREQIRLQEEERERQEAENQRIIKEEEQKRKIIEQKAEEEKAHLQAEAIKVRKRNRRRLSVIGAVVAAMVIAALLYFWYYAFDHESYYAQFERVNGWPVGIGEELSSSERAKTPLYYKLSHKGHLNHDTDVEVMSSNEKLPLRPRINAFEVSDNDNKDTKANEFYAMLLKVKYIHFVEGEQNRIDKEVVLDENGNTLFVLNYFHLPNKNEAWIQYVTSTGQALQVRDNNVDRIKLSWFHDEENISNPNNGKVESVMYYDVLGVCKPVSHGICGFLMRYSINGEQTTRIALDEYSQPIQNNLFNVLISKQYGDTLETRYAKSTSIEDSLYRSARNIEGYSKVVRVKDKEYLYDEKNYQIAIRTYTYDSKGNVLFEKTIGEHPIPYPALISYEYDSQTGYMKCEKKLDKNNKPFASTIDSIYKKVWDYTKEGDLALEQHENVNGRIVYTHRITHKNNVVLDFIEDVANNKYETFIDSTKSFGRTISYYGKNGTPIIHKAVDKEDTLYYHRLIVENTKFQGHTYLYYYTLDETGHVIPCPKKLNEYGKALSFFCKERQQDKDGNEIWYRLYDENNNIIKSMMYIYQNGQSIARAAMGIDKKPVRCPVWEEEGYAYYKIYYGKDFDHHYVRIKAVDEFEMPSIFYDNIAGIYQIISYTDYKGADIKFKGKDTQINYSYKQYSLDDATNISSTNIAYLHILSKNSMLYNKGLRDGDRIMKLGNWKFGMNLDILSQEWERSLKSRLTIEVLRPSKGVFLTIKKDIKRGDSHEEEYHVYRLTNEEFSFFNKHKSI